MTPTERAESVEIVTESVGDPRDPQTYVDYAKTSANIAAAIAAAEAEAVEREREACEEACETIRAKWAARGADSHATAVDEALVDGQHEGAKECRAAIRARGTPTEEGRHG